MASFSLANQDVVVCIASEDKDCNTNAGTGHDDSCPEQILGRNWLATCAEILFLTY